MTIHYIEYATVGDYIKRIPLFPYIKSDYADRLTLIRGALTVGLAPKGLKKLSRELIEWKITTILTFVDAETPFTIRNIGDSLESSEKVTVAYFIGMVFAQIHMQKHYGVRHLQHLKNPGLTVDRDPNDLKNPDLWGYNPITKLSYLVEAKGSTIKSSYFTKKHILKAQEQLKAINGVACEISGIVEDFNETNSNFKKLIIATHPNSDSHMMQHIIDPPNEEGKILKINGDELAFNHYFNIIRLMNELEEDLITDDLLGTEFVYINLEKFDCYIGVMKRIYDLLNPIVNMINETEYVFLSEKDSPIVPSQYFEGLEEKINFHLNFLNKKNSFLENGNSDFTLDGTPTSLGNDGIIVFTKKLDAQNIISYNKERI